MITVEQAKDILITKTGLLGKESIEIINAIGFIVAENIKAPIQLPPYAQSAMDGYAIRFTDRKKNLKVTREIKAGDNTQIIVRPGEAIRIFTGAKVPAHADCVVMQEKTLYESGSVIINDPGIKKGDNIRMPGMQIMKGESAIAAGSILNPAGIGFLASLGISEVLVYRKPKVGIIVTGNELKSAGVKLTGSQIYESNSFSLNAALQEKGFRTDRVMKVKDNKTMILKAIRKALEEVDVLLISGGISVGKYDLVKDCLMQAGVKELFYKIAQKPGKPLFAGTKGKKIVFALPGNPAATLVCFYEYVYPVLRKMMGHSECFLPKIKLKAKGKVRVLGDRSNFLKGKIQDDTVYSLDGQESYILKSFADANALIYVPAALGNHVSNGYIEEGTLVEVHLI